MNKILFYKIFKYIVSITIIQLYHFKDELSISKYLQEERFFYYICRIKWWTTYINEEPLWEV